MDGDKVPGRIEREPLFGQDRVEFRRRAAARNQPHPRGPGHD